MSTDRARFCARRLAVAAGMSVAILAGTAQSPSLRIASASPTGDLAQLADAEQVRIVFSEPMIALGTVVSNTAPSWIRITPSTAGTFYWSGTKTLIFSPDASTPLPFATSFTVRVDSTATSVAGRALEQPYEFTFTTPTVRLLQADWYRKNGRFDSPAVLVLGFNQPVRPRDVLAHARVELTPHAWTAPQLSPEAREVLRQTDPTGLARFDDKVAAVRRVTSSSDAVGLRLADSWDETRFPRAPERVVIETTTAPPPDAWLSIALDDTLPSQQGPRTHAAQSAVVKLEPTFFVRKMGCEGPCGPSRHNPIEFTGGMAWSAFAHALTIADVTDPGAERPVVPAGNLADHAAQRVTTYVRPQDVGFEDQPAARIWRLQLARDIVAADGQTLDYPWVGVVEHMHDVPFIAFDGGVWEAGRGTEMLLHSRNALSITEWLAPVMGSWLMPRLLELRQKAPTKPPAGGRTRRLSVVPDTVQAHSLDVRQLLSSRGTGLLWAALAGAELLPRYAAPSGAPYEVVDRSDPRRLKRALIQVTNLGVTVKDSPQSTLVFVTGLDTGAPVPGARVTIVDTGNRIRWRGTTDGDGIALAPALALRTPWDPSQFSFVVTAEKNGDFAFVGSDWNGDVHPAAFDIDYRIEEPAGTLRGHVFTDRGAYKETEEVHVKAVVRADSPAGIRLLPENDALEIAVRDARGSYVDRRTVKVNRWSSAEWTWNVPAGAALGQYEIEVVPGGAKLKEGEVPNVSGRFLVAAYRRPDFRVDATLSSEPAVLGSTLRGTVDAKYLFGGALSARPVRWWFARARVQRAPDAVRERYPDASYAVGYPPPDDEPRGAETPRSEATTTLGADGRAVVPLPTKAEGDLAYLYNFGADVEDVSGQHIADHASLVVHPASIYVALSRPPVFVDTKIGASVDVVAVDLSGESVSGVSVTVSLLREEWVTGRPAEGGSYTPWERREIPAGEWTVRTTVGETSMPISVRDGGRYVLRAVARDAVGRQTRTDVTFHAIGPRLSSWPSDGHRIDLTPERKTWKPGETARILIESPWPRATALVTVEREGIRSHRSVTLTSTQHTVDVPITEADVPNVFVSVLLVKGRTSTVVDAGGRDGGQPGYRVGYTELSVDDSSKRLRVDVSADREEYRPRQSANVSVTVTAQDGEPARGEVTLWAIDHGLLSLTDYETPDVLKAIYLPRPLQVLTADSRQRLMTGRPMVAPAGFDADLVQTSRQSRSEFVSVQAAPPLPGDVRQDFGPLVFWLGSATTDADGRAMTTVTLPDSLTTYRIMAVAGNRESQFGFGEREIRVTKPLTLLPAFPRFLNQGDGASFGAVVTNSGKESGNVVVTIQSLAPETLQFSGGASQTFSLAAGASESVKFDAVASGSGKARVRMTVTLGADSDAFEMPLDVALPMRMETTAAYGETVGTATERLVLPAGVSAGSGGLTVELASTALVGLGEAARYLDEYPYDCAEQQASRARALLLASDVGGAFRISGVKPDQYRVAGAKVLNDLYAYQCDNGGFSLWRGRCESVSAYLTAYVLHTMEVASRGQTGVRPGSNQGQTPIVVRRDVIERALDYLERELDGPPSQVEWWPVWGASQAYAVKVLAEFGRKPAEDIDRLIGVADRLPIFALSYLADALAASNDRGPRYHDVVRRLTNALRIEADRAHVEEIDDAALGWLWNTNVRATAVVLDGLARRKDDPTFVAPLVRWLVAARTNGRWGTTHENAMALEALVAYYRVFESEVPRMTTTVTVGSEIVGTSAFSGRSTTAQQVQMSMQALLRELALTTQPTLSISRTGTGRVYYTARVQSSAPERPEALDRGFRVERRYERYVKDSTGQPVTAFSAGDLIRVTVAVTVRGEGRYLALTDPLPAGFEPIEAWFNTTARDLAREATRTNADDDWRSWWRGGDFDHVEKHDDRVIAFATRLGSGRHEFSYLVRATTAGTFGVGGARVEAMYAPELEGRSQAVTVTVK